MDRVRALIERMKMEQKSFETLQAAFEQRVSAEMLLEVEESRGRFYYQAPDKVAWEYDHPTPKIVVVNGEELVTWYRDLGRAERMRVGRYSDQVFKYLGASGSLEALTEYFVLRVRFPEDDGEPYLVDLSPRYDRVRKRLEGMSVAVDSRTFIPTRLHYIEPGGDSTEYQFSDIRVNEAIPQSHFELEFPADVEVRERQLR